MNNTKSLKLINSARLQSHKLVVRQSRIRRLKARQKINKMIKDKKKQEQEHERNKHLPITKNSNNKKKNVNLTFNRHLINLLKIAHEHKNNEFNISASNQHILKNIQILIKMKLITVSRSKDYIKALNIKLTSLGKDFVINMLKFKIRHHYMVKGKMYNWISNILIPVSMVTLVSLGFMINSMILAMVSLIVALTLSAIVGVLMDDKASTNLAKSHISSPKINKCMGFFKQYVNYDDYTSIKKELLKTANKN